MLKAERISRSGPKLSDAQTRNFEAIKYSTLTVLSYMLETIAPDTSWRSRLLDLMEERLPREEWRAMGFRDGWEKCPLWSKWLVNEKADESFSEESHQNEGPQD